MKRKDARENAFKVLFEISFSDGADVDETMTLAAENMGYEFDDYCRGLIKGVVSEKEKIDSVLNEFSTKWKTDRLSRVALCASEIAVSKSWAVKFRPQSPSTRLSNLSKNSIRIQARNT